MSSGSRTVSLLFAALAGMVASVPASAQSGEPCAPDAITLCLHEGRFEVRVAWQDFQGGAGDGHPLPLTGDTGAFWFFRDTNLELMVKVLDGRSANGFWWVFYGSLSNVPFTLTVTDTATGTPRTYENPPRSFASRGDTRGFPAVPGAAAPAAALETAPAAVGVAASEPPPRFAAPVAATAAPGTGGAWTALGPDGGPIRAVVAAGGDPDTLYAASSVSGVFRSDDGGDIWSILPSSRERPGDHVLEMHEGPDGVLYVLYVGGSIHRSADGGETWTVLPMPGFLVAGTMAVDPLTPGVLYVAYQAGLRKSEDGGVTWRQIPGFPRETGPPGRFLEIEDLTFDAAGDTLWAATFGGVYRSADGGESWQPAGAGLHAFTREIQALAAVPGSPGRLYAATGGGVYETTDGGDSWAWKGPGQSFEVRGLVVDPADARHLWAVTSGRPEESFDGGETWQAVTALPDPVHGLTPDPRGNRPVYAGSDQGLHRSLDGGATWQRADRGLHAHYLFGLDARPDAPGRLLAAGNDAIFRSTDAGATWSRVLDGDARFLASSAADPATIYAAGDYRIHRSLDGGLTWDPAGSFETYLADVWGDPIDPEVAFTAGTQAVIVDPPPARVYRTLDGGETWQIVSFTSGTVWDLAIGPGAPGEPEIVLYSSGLDELHRSTDGGATFEPAGGGGLPSFLAIVDLVADPLQPGRFLGSVAPVGLWETLDGGDSWRPFGVGLPPAATPRLLLQPDAPTVVYAAIDGLGAFRSVDRGATWFPIGGEGPFEQPTGWLTLGVTGDPPRLYAATDRGVWSILAVAATAPCAPGPTTLCLHGGRFRVEVEWEDFEGGSGAGHPHPLTGDTGAFWFFRETNLELAVKVLDGRTLNGHWWVFYGSLSNVPFSLRVTDTVTGAPRIYENPPRSFASRGDTTAF